jgi:hypothetical protein
MLWEPCETKPSRFRVMGNACLRTLNQTTRQSLNGERFARFDDSIATVQRHFRSICLGFIVGYNKSCRNAHSVDGQAMFSACLIISWAEACGARCRYKIW